MTRGEARTEFFARGFDYLSATRANAYLSRSLAALSVDTWPWLEATATGTAPLTITNLRAVLSAIDSTTKTVLRPMDRRTLTDAYPDLTETGPPVYWYREDLTSLKVYPANTADTITVRYIAHETEITSDATSPLMPVRHHNVWVDRAVYEAYCDSDNFESANMLKNKIDNEVMEMRLAYLQPNLDQPYLIASRGY